MKSLVLKLLPPTDKHIFYTLYIYMYACLCTEYGPMYRKSEHTQLNTDHIGVSNPDSEIYGRYHSFHV